MARYSEYGTEDVNAYLDTIAEAWPEQLRAPRLLGQHVDRVISSAEKCDLKQMLGAYISLIDIQTVVREEIALAYKEERLDNEERRKAHNALADLEPEVRGLVRHRLVSYCGCKQEEA
jgi:hypothetical protein